LVKKRGKRGGLCPQITGPMHADEKRKSSEFFICVNLRHLRAIPDSVPAGRAVFLSGKDLLGIARFLPSGPEVTDISRSAPVMAWKGNWRLTE
jgi:hypothetical protein